MKQGTKHKPAQATQSRLNRIYNVLQPTAVVAAMLAVALLGIRQITSTDLGYHLDFGETLFNTGKIVDHVPYIYTLPGPDTTHENRPDPGPTCWYDAEGRYRFPNANWLSQWVMYLSWKSGQINGISVLQFALSTSVFMLVFAVMLQLGIKKTFAAAGLLLIAVVAYSRFNLRPEVFGMACYTLQFAVLARAYRKEAIAWFEIAALIVIQLIFVNSHSYFLLSLCLTGVFFVEYFFRVMLARSKGVIDENYMSERAMMQRLGIALLGMVLICFLNPWTWRLAILPVETLAYMSEHMIGGSRAIMESHPWSGEVHPWARITEFKSTFSGRFLQRPSGYATIGMLILASAGMLSQVSTFIGNKKVSGKKGRRSSKKDRKQQKPRIYFAMILLIIGMTLVGLKMRRNIAIASIAIVPAALMCLSISRASLNAWSPKRVPNKLKIYSLVVLLVLTGYFGFTIVTDRFYKAEHNIQRFGIGLRNEHLPVGAVKWMDEHMPGAKVWCDMASSSNLRFFTEPRKEVPLLSNTWAYPPEIMQQVFRYRYLRRPIEEVVNQYDIDAIVLRYIGSRPLHRYLVDDQSWEVVYIEGVFAIYATYESKYADVVRKFRKMKATLPY